MRSVQKLMAVMTGDGIKPDLQTYAMSLYCLSHNADADPVIVQYILTDMEREVMMIFPRHYKNLPMQYTEKKLI